MLNTVRFIQRILQLLGTEVFCGYFFSNKFTVHCWMRFVTIHVCLLFRYSCPSLPACPLFMIVGKGHQTEDENWTELPTHDVIFNHNDKFSLINNVVNVYLGKLKSTYATFFFLQVFEIRPKKCLCFYMKWSLKLSDLNDSWNGSTIFLKNFQHKI
jgi:hypothetical protein